jgi:parallel beta-helix repeat protein
MTSSSPPWRFRRTWLIITCFAAVASLPEPRAVADGPQGGPPEITLAEGNRVITQSVRIKPGQYEFADPDSKGAVRVEADNVTLDFQGATLQSCDVDKAKRDKLVGIGIDVQGRKNVTIKNAKIHGYKYNIRVLDSENVRIESCDVSYSLGHRVMDHGIASGGFLGLRSVGAWRVYGGGIWLEKVRNGTVRRCSGLNAQNGALLVGSDHCLVTDNDFSFNSGWGIGLYQSSDNVVGWNLTDFCVRPDRGRLGADSAAIVVANDCHRNFFVGNSMTHSGDGFFLTNLTDTGYDPKVDQFLPKGSSDDNVIAYNDSSWSPCNAFEGTFSYRNVYYKNLANDSGYGFWLGFSSDSLVADNQIERTLYEGVAIEQGHGNLIEHNTIVDTQGIAVHLHAGTGKAREGFPSKNLEIRDNTIRNAKAAFDLTNSTEYYVGNNTVQNAPLPEGLASSKQPNPTTGLDRFLASEQRKKLDEVLATKPKEFKFYRETGGPKGTLWIDFDEYCPRNVRSALAAYRTVGWGALDLYVPDPQGTKIVAPDWAAVTADPKSPNRRHLEVAKPDPAVGGLLPYSIKLTNGNRTQEIQGELLDVTWHLKWFRWDEPKKLDPGDEAGWRGLFAGKPILEQTSHNPEWGKIWPVPVPTVPAINWAMSATSRVKLPAGTYRFLAFYAGGMTIKIDGKDVINNWKDSRWMQGGEKILELTEGEHEIVIQNYREKSYFFLKLYWGLVKPS